MSIRPFEGAARRTQPFVSRSLSRLGNSRMSGVERTVSTDTDLFTSFGLVRQFSSHPSARCASAVEISRSLGYGRLAHRLDERREDVPCTSFGADQRRSRTLRLDLPAKTAYLHVNRAVIHLVVVKARQLEQLLSRKYALRGGQKSNQKIELAVRRRNRFPLRRPQPSQPDV